LKPATPATRIRTVITWQTSTLLVIAALLGLTAVPVVIVLGTETTSALRTE
jgi:hypothetical protein